MTSNNFDKLYNGEGALFADLSKFNKELNNQFNMNTLRSFVNQNEEPIPEQMNKEVQSLIEYRRSLGDNESKIRNIIKKVFKITIV